MCKNVLSSVLLILVVNFYYPANASDFHWLKTYSNQTVNIKKETFLNGQVNKKLLSTLDSIYIKTPNSYYFLGTENGIRVFCDCGFDLFKVDDFNLINQYQYFNRGYSCSSIPFIKDNAVHILGGYGFWTFHSDLLAFDNLYGAWEFVKTINQPQDYFSKVAFQTDEGVIVLFGTYSNQRKNLFENELEGGYFLEWKSKIWKKVVIDVPKIKQIASYDIVETKDFLLMSIISNKDNFGWFIIDKESLNVYNYDFKNVDVFISPFIEVINNVITFQTPNGSLKTFDLSEMILKFVKVGSIVIKEVTIIDRIVSKYLVFLVLTIIIAFILIVYLTIRLKKGSFQVVQDIVKETKPITTIIKSLEEYNGKIIDSETLDMILELPENGNIESKRVKRYRLIQEINQQYILNHRRSLIFKVRSDEDKRIVYYQIKI